MHSWENMIYREREKERERAIVDCGILIYGFYISYNLKATTQSSSVSIESLRSEWINTKI